MTTQPIVTITDELLAELEEECALAAELDINAAVVPAHITALLSHIADLKQQLVAAGITAENCELFRKDAERYRWLRDACDNDPGNLGIEYAASPGVDAAIDAARSAGGGS